VLAAMLASQQKQNFGFIIHAGDIRYQSETREKQVG
jgi:hypothetical protein